MKISTKTLIFAFAAFGAAISHASMFGAGNLLSNPGADGGSPSAGGGVIAVPGWTGTAGVGFYGVGEWWEIPSGAWASGTQFFHGGSTAANTITQTYTVGAEDFDTVDAGHGLFTLNGWFGGWQGQDDNATLTASFKDGSTVLGTSDVLGGFNAVDRGGESKMLFDEQAGVVIPVGTREITFTLVSTRVGGGSSNDGVADSLGFSAQAVPEPTTMAALAGGVALLRRRRARR